jgi:hypothetical protein
MGLKEIIQEANKTFKQLSFARGTTLAVIGICIVAFGAYNNHYNIRLAGVIVAAGGLLIMGNRLYVKIQEKAQIRAKARKKKLTQFEDKAIKNKDLKENELLDRAI